MRNWLTSGARGFQCLRDLDNPKTRLQSCNNLLGFTSRSVREPRQLIRGISSCRRIMLYRCVETPGNLDVLETVANSLLLCSSYIHVSYVEVTQNYRFVNYRDEGIL